jgi:hypothetical protein
LIIEKGKERTMNNPMIFAHLREVYSDLDKILDAASCEKVPVHFDDNGNPTEFKAYTMSNNAYQDILGVQNYIRRIIAQFEGGF